MYVTSPPSQPWAISEGVPSIVILLRFGAFLLLKQMGVCSGIAYTIYTGFYDTMSHFKDILVLLKTALEMSVHAGEI